MSDFEEPVRTQVLGEGTRLCRVRMLYEHEDDPNVDVKCLVRTKGRGNVLPKCVRKSLESSARSIQRGFDDTSTQNDISIIKNCGLPRSEGTLWPFEFNRHLFSG